MPSILEQLIKDSEARRNAAVLGQGKAFDVGSTLRLGELQNLRGIEAKTTEHSRNLESARNLARTTKERELEKQRLANRGKIAVAEEGAKADALTSFTNKGVVLPAGADPRFASGIGFVADQLGGITGSENLSRDALRNLNLRKAGIKPESLTRDIELPPLSPGGPPIRGTVPLSAKEALDPNRPVVETTPLKTGTDIKVAPVFDQRESGTTRSRTFRQFVPKIGADGSNLGFVEQTDIVETKETDKSRRAPGGLPDVTPQQANNAYNNALATLKRPAHPKDRPTNQVIEGLSGEKSLLIWIWDEASGKHRAFHQPIE